MLQTVLAAPESIHSPRNASLDRSSRKYHARSVTMEWDVENEAGVLISRVGEGHLSTVKILASDSRSWA